MRTWRHLVRVMLHLSVKGPTDSPLTSIACVGYFGQDGLLVEMCKKTPKEVFKELTEYCGIRIFSEFY